MIPYIAFASVPMILGLIHQYCNEKNNTKDRKKIFVILLGVVLFFMIAFRSKYIGSTDSYNYYDNWLTLSKLSWYKVPEFIQNTGMESGFCYIVWAFSRVFPDPQWAFVLTGVLFSCAVSNFIYRFCEDIFLAFAMYITLGLYTFMIQGMRQAIAMAILLFALNSCKKRKLISFLILVLLALAFHKTAIIFLPVYFLYGLKIKPLSLIVSLLGVAGMIACSPYVVSVGQQWFDRTYASKAESGGFVALLIYILILAFVLLFATKRYEDKDFAFFFFFTLIGATFYLMRYTGVMIAERISFYFMFGQMALFPAAINTLAEKERFFLKFAVYALILMLFIYRLNGSDLVPFEFFWQEA